MSSKTSDFSALPPQFVSPKTSAQIQFETAQKYEKGLEVEQSASKAAKCYMEAAQQGHVQARYRLAWMYEKGQGVEQSYQKCREWRTKACASGIADMGGFDNFYYPVESKPVISIDDRSMYEQYRGK